MLVHYSNGRETTVRLAVHFTLDEARALIALLSDSEGWHDDELAALERVRKAWAAEECDRVDASADRHGKMPAATENAPATQRRPGAEPRGVSS